MTGTLLSFALSGALFFSSGSAAPIVPLTQNLPQDNWVGYSVEKPQSLSAIAQVKYGEEKYWTTLWNDNTALNDPEAVQAGTILKIRAEKPESPEELINELSDKLQAKKQSMQVVAFAQEKAFVTNPVALEQPQGSRVLTEEQVNFLGSCEAGMDPAKNTGNGYYGAFQFSHGTWKSMNTGYERADLAPIEVQKDAVQRLVQRSSIFTQFPACASRMRSVGLI